MNLYRAKHFAMATEFEVLISLEDVDGMQAAQAAHAVFEEIDRLELELSRFKPGADVWRINHLKAGANCRVGLATLDCLQLARAVHAETAGAFDITVGPLMRVYRHEDGSMRTPHHLEVDYARERVGMHLFEMTDDGVVTVHVDEPVLDLGAVGKGYALDQAVQMLHDYGVQNALLNAGESSLLGLGHQAESEGWPVTVGNRAKRIHVLKDRALSASGFAVKGAHIMNPRTKRPAPIKKKRTWAEAPTAALSDALSTAFTVMTPDEIASFCARHPEVEAILD